MISAQRQPRDPAGDRLLAQIRSACVKRVLDLLDKLAKDEPEKFRKFTDAFGNVLKEGIAEDHANSDRIASSALCLDESGRRAADRLTG